MTMRYKPKPFEQTHHAGSPIFIAPTLRRAAQYVRMSTDQQKYSIDNQKQAISEYALCHESKSCVLTPWRPLQSGRSRTLFFYTRRHPITPDYVRPAIAELPCCLRFESKADMVPPRMMSVFGYMVDIDDWQNPQSVNVDPVREPSPANSS